MKCQSVEELVETLEYMISDECTETQHDFIEEIEMVIEILTQIG